MLVKHCCTYSGSTDNNKPIQIHNAELPKCEGTAKNGCHAKWVRAFEQTKNHGLSV